MGYIPSNGLLCTKCMTLAGEPSHWSVRGLRTCYRGASSPLGTSDIFTATSVLRGRFYGVPG
jgi:hypothetical protein